MQWGRKGPWRGPRAGDKKTREEPKLFPCAFRRDLAYFFLRVVFLAAFRLTAFFFTAFLAVFLLAAFFFNELY